MESHRKITNRICSICGVESFHGYKVTSTKNHGVLCSRHIQQIDLYGKIINTDEPIRPKEKICVFCGSSNYQGYMMRKHPDEKGKWLCKRHHIQYKKFGHCVNHTRYTPNEINVIDDIGYMDMYDPNNNLLESKIMIDPDDIDRVSQYRWSIDHRGYGYNKTVGLLHRFILRLDSSDSRVGDHIKGNKSDNRKSKIRICESNQNNKNKSKVKTDYNNGKFPGVTHRTKNSWAVSLTIHRAIYKIGSFKTFQEAKAVKIHAEILLWGKYAPVRDDIVYDTMNPTNGENQEMIDLFNMGGLTGKYPHLDKVIKLTKKTKLTDFINDQIKNMRL